jgi:signal transduction histidine kinase
VTDNAFDVPQQIIADLQRRLDESVARQAATANDLSESLAQQAATANVLKAINRSSFDLESVLTTLTESAKTLCGAAAGVIYRREGENYCYAASTMDVPDVYREHEQRTAIQAGRGTLIGRVALERGVVQIPDALTDPEYEEKEHVHRGGDARCLLGVPLMLNGEQIGAFGLAKHELVPFTPRQVELVTTFADQAIIAIENARLFDEVQQRTRELSLSLDELRAAQDRLVQTEKLASLGQLTAGIAHEIKNPLNFVNNFSTLSIELIAELRDVLKLGQFEGTARQEADELTDTLASNLEKVVQHGRRADSIVKNMLLHSRTGSGERRSADVNALVEESLNLAYHGARAENSNFDITLRRDLAPDAGVLELYPQEITRVLLNLISNGFYAATRRKRDAGDENFEPTLSATTRALSNRVEIRIRDNGAGIPPEVRDKIFNPFFTTKPAGEGTGLGLSMSHDIIVKQHGGTIAVDTDPGAFTEFIITLPRDGTAQFGQR